MNGRFGAAAAAAAAFAFFERGLLLRSRVGLMVYLGIGTGPGGCSGRRRGRRSLPFEPPTNRLKAGCSL